MLGNNHNSDLH